MDDWLFRSISEPSFLLEGGFDFGELRVGVRANVRDRCNDDDDDQSHHDGVLNSGRAIFGNQKVLHARDEILHYCPLLCFAPSGAFPP